MKAFISMNCPACGHGSSRVKSKTNYHSDITRRRECLKCGVRFTTTETINKKQQKGQYGVQTTE